LPFARIAESVNFSLKRFEMAHQHVCFYRRRLLKNQPLLTGFFGSEGVILPNTAFWAKEFISEVRHFDLQDFNTKYFSFQARGFMSKH